MMSRAQAGAVFFDRGVPDVIGYLRLMGLPIPAHMERAAETFRYSRRVFVSPPWREIFKQDSERKQSYEEAEGTYEAMVATYAGYGYELAMVPRLPLGQRVQFVIENVGTTGAVEGEVDCRP
jgi:predicted ATPase